VFNLLLDFLFDFVDLFLFLEVFVFPQMCLVEQTVGSVARIEDHLVSIRLEIRLAQIGAGRLQRIKKKAFGLVLDLSGKQQTHNLLQRHLDRVGVFKHGQEKCGGAATAAIAIQPDALVLIALVKEAKTVTAQRGRSALRAAGLDVLTTIWVRQRHTIQNSSSKVSKTSCWFDLLLGTRY